MKHKIFVILLLVSIKF